MTASRSTRNIPGPFTHSSAGADQSSPRDKGAGDLLFTSGSGHQLHASALKRSVAWQSIAAGRRIHDLRHTAACLWLAKGVDPVTVQAWMGHASIATTNLYLHHLGTAADLAGLGRLNASGNAGGTQQGISEERTERGGDEST